MKRGIIWIALTFVLIGSLVLASCSSSTTATSTTSTPTSTTTAPVIPTSTAPTSIPTSTTSVNTPTTAATTTSTGNWWDSLGTPRYGGTLTISLPTDITGWDNYSDSGMTSIIPAYEEALTTDDWTLNPSVFAYQLSYRSSNYEVGYLRFILNLRIPKLMLSIYAKMFTGRIFHLRMAPNLPQLM